MNERPQRLDALLNFGSRINCGHRHGSYFDRTVCPAPCSAMHDRCKDCGEPLDACALQREDGED
jgi:hypothetical protein